MTRRTYYMRIEVRESTERGLDAGPVLLAAKSVRCRLGIFQVNEWREIAIRECGEMGFKIGDQFGRHDRREWPVIAFIYGSFNKDGKGRSASALMRIPAKYLRAPEDQETPSTIIPEGAR